MVLATEGSLAAAHKVGGVSSLARRVDILALLKAVCDGTEGGRAACGCPRQQSCRSFGDVVLAGVCTERVV